MRLPQIPLVLASALAAAPAAGVGAAERRVSLAPTEFVRVVEAGEGAPVVLVPGLLGSAFGFRHLLPRLAASGRRVLVVEPLGVGGSSRPSAADYSLTAQADRISRTLEALGVGPAVVVAHAVGASMALRLAYRHPQRVSAVVSLDGGPAESAATPGFRRAMRFAPLLKLFGGSRRIRGKVRSALRERSADPRWVTEAVVDGYVEGASADLDATLAAFRGMAQAREPQELRPRLADIRCPVRLLLGGVPHEGAPSPEEVALLRERLPFFSSESVPAAGHFLFEEAPDAVVAAVARALERPAVAGVLGGRP